MFNKDKAKFNQTDTEKPSFPNKEILLANLDKVHTIEMGVARIKKNLELDIDDAVEYCKSKISDENCHIY